MPEREVKRNPIRSLYHYYKAISSEFKEWASDHCFLFFLIILFIILQFIIIAVLALAIVNSYTGIVRYSNDYYWKGQKKYGHAHGTGKLFNFADIVIYEGTMSFDKYDGQGISFYINGEKEFEGEWEMGMKKKGSFYSLSGQLLYDGECKDNIYQGYGDAYENGVLRFRGTFDNGFKRHGIFYDDNGNILYSGSCVDDLFHGYGEYYSNNHLSFSGSFVDGMRSGRGVSYSNSNQPLFIGIWEQDSMEYGLLFNKKGDIVTRGIVPSSILYIQHDQDLNLLNDSTEEIVIAPNTHLTNSSLEISHLPQLKYITVLNGSCQNVTSFYLHDLPSLEIIQVYSKSFSHLNELTLFDVDSVLLDSAMNGSVIIENCKVLRTIDFAPFTFVHFNNLSLSNLPALSSLSIGIANNSGLLNEQSFNFYPATSLSFTNLPNLETLEIGSSSCFFSHMLFENLPRLQSLLVGFEAGGLSSGLVFKDLPSFTSILLYTDAWKSVNTVWVSDVPLVDDFSYDDGALQSVETVYYRGNVSVVFINTILLCTNVTDLVPY